MKTSATTTHNRPCRVRATIYLSMTYHTSLYRNNPFHNLEEEQTTAHEQDPNQGLLLKIKFYWT